MTTTTTLSTVVLDGVVEDAVPVVNYIAHAVDAHVASVLSHRVAVRTFEESALAFADAVDHGVKVAALVAALKAARESGATVEYAAAGIVGSHARTGRVARLSGDLPEDVTLRNVQSIIKTIPAKDADIIIGAAKDRASAYAALSAWTAPAPAAEDAEDAEGAEGAQDKPEKSALDILKGVTAAVDKACALVESADNVDAETLAALDYLLAALAGARSVATEVPEDAADLV